MVRSKPSKRTSKLPPGLFFDPQIDFRETAPADPAECYSFEPPALTPADMRRVIRFLETIDDHLMQPVIDPAIRPDQDAAAKVLAPLTWKQSGPDLDVHLIRDGRLAPLLYSTEQDVRAQQLEQMRPRNHVTLPTDTEGN